MNIMDIKNIDIKQIELYYEINKLDKIYMSIDEKYHKSIDLFEAVELDEELSRIDAKTDYLKKELNNYYQKNYDTNYNKSRYFEIYHLLHD